VEVEKEREWGDTGRRRVRSEGEGVAEREGERELRRVNRRE